MKEKCSNMEVALADDGEVGSNNVFTRSVIIFCTLTIESSDTQNYCHDPFLAFPDKSLASKLTIMYGLYYSHLLDGKSRLFLTRAWINKFDSKIGYFGKHNR